MNAPSSSPPDSAAAVMRIGPVIPVVTIDDPGDAALIAGSLVRGGLPVIEVTLRTARAYDAIRRIASEVPEIVVGAGTVTTTAHLDQAVSAGAQFLVSPGVTPDLICAARQAGIPFIPGATTTSEVMSLVSAGFDRVKFFPAECSGGIHFLNAVRPVLPDVEFCPTGGISRERTGHYLRLANVSCVGASWPVDMRDVNEQKWTAIERQAHFATTLLSRSTDRHTHGDRCG